METVYQARELWYCLNINRLAEHLYSLDELEGVMETSLTKTLAS